MTLVVTHSTVTGASADSSALVDGTDWDANHTLTGVVSASQGGTGISNNDSSTLTISGAFGTTFTVSATTSLTLPTTGTLATTSNKLSAFAATTSAELAGVISDETGSGPLVFATSPTLVTPTLGVASATSVAIGGSLTSGQVLTGTGSGSLTGYLRVGSATAPTNTTEGDLTSTRLSVGNGALSASNGQLSYFSGTITATSGTEIAVGIIPKLSPASASSAGFRTLLMSTNVNSAQNFTGTIDSGYFENRVVNAGTIGTLDGGRFFGLVAASTGASLGNVSIVNGVLVQAVSSFSNSLTATIASTHGVHVVNPANSGSGPLTLTSQAGVTIESLSAATNNTHLLIGTGTIPTGANYAIYSSSTSSSLLAGSIKSSHATGGVGYATGAGGAVTQATSKSTGVTLNKVCGQITMNNAALNAGTSVSFTLTNSAIAATDVVSVNIASAASADSYTVDVTAVAAGSCRIQVYNFTAGNLSEALVLNFAVIKAVAA